jgi:hypothetical protein
MDKASSVLPVFSNSDNEDDKIDSTTVFPDDTSEDQSKAKDFVLNYIGGLRLTLIPGGNCAVGAPWLPWCSHQYAAKIPRQHTPRTIIILIRKTTFSRLRDQGGAEWAVNILSRNRGDVAPLVEFLQRFCCRNRCICSYIIPVTVVQQNRFLSEPILGSPQTDCTSNGPGIYRYPLVEQPDVFLLPLCVPVSYGTGLQYEYILVLADLSVEGGGGFA